MSDLQCPATLLVARHGDAEYARPGCLSDDGGWLSDAGRRQVHQLVQDLRSVRVAAVWSSTATTTRGRRPSSTAGWPVTSTPVARAGRTGTPS
ncbi:MAG: histidine phosphatase family protein [Oryzihumus sp.]